MFDKIKEVLKFLFTERYTPSADRGEELLRAINVTKYNIGFRVNHSFEGIVGYGFYDYSEKMIQDICAYFVSCNFFVVCEKIEKNYWKIFVSNREIK